MKKILLILVLSVMAGTLTSCKKKKTEPTPKELLMNGIWDLYDLSYVSKQSVMARYYEFKENNTYKLYDTNMNLIGGDFWSLDDSGSRPILYFKNDLFVIKKLTEDDLIVEALDGGYAVYKFRKKQ